MGAEVIQKIFDIKIEYGDVAQKLIELTKRNIELSETEKKLKKEFKEHKDAEQYAKALAPITQEKKKNTEAINKYTQAMQNEIKTTKSDIENMDKLFATSEKLYDNWTKMSRKERSTPKGQAITNELLEVQKQYNEVGKRVLNQSFDSATNSLNGMKTKIQEMTAEYRAMSKEMRQSPIGKELAAEIANTTKAYNAEIDVLKKATKGIRENTDSVNGLRVKLQALYSQYDALDKKTREGAGSKQLRKEIEQVRKEIEKAEQATGRYNRNVGNYMSALKGLGSRMMNMFVGVTTVAQLFVKIGDAMMYGVTAATEYNRELSKLAAIMQTTVQQNKELNAQSKLLGSTTRYTATQVAQLQVELAKLGYKKSQIINMAESVLYLAQSTGSELADAASLAGAALRIFGDDSSQAAKYVDQMAVSTANSALSFDYIRTALPIVGGAAQAFGFTLKDTLSLIGRLADTGMDASMAATATRNMLLKLADANGELARQIGKPVKSLPELVEALRI